jgi:hypothetical protein
MPGTAAGSGSEQHVWWKKRPRDCAQASFHGKRHPGVTLLDLAHADDWLARQDWHLLTAGGFISMLPPLFVFFALQRYFVRGLLAGSVKG